MNRLLALSAAALLSAGCTLTLDPDQYAPASCGANEKACGYKCVPIDDPSTGCSNPGCGACPGAGSNQHAVCDVDRACAAACNAGFGDCDGGPSNGCETPVTTPASCGACGRSCVGSTCQADATCVPRVASVQAAIPDAVAVTGLATESVMAPSTAYLVGTLPGPTPTGFTARVDATGAGIVSASAAGLPAMSELFVENGSGWVGVFDSLGGAGGVSVMDMSAPSLTVENSQPTYGFPVDLAPGVAGFWWGLPFPGTGKLCHFTSSTICVNLGAPVRAIAVAPSFPTPVYAYVADEAGTLWQYGEPLNAAIAPVAVVTSAGRVGRMTARKAAAAGGVEVYWTDLDTGDLRVWRSGTSGFTAVFRGAGPVQPGKEWMDVESTETSPVFWTNQTTGQVMKHDPDSGKGAVLVGSSPSPQRIAVANDGWIYWSDANNRVYSTVW